MGGDTDDSMHSSEFIKSWDMESHNVFHKAKEDEKNLYLSKHK